MVLLNLVVRPKPGYHNPGKIRKIQVDTSQRVEDIVAKLKLQKKGTHFYANGRELPLNSSIASHNIQDGTVIETCNCPALSVVLSAVLKDFDAIKQLSVDVRDEASVRPLLDGAALDPWPDRWAPQDIETRIICLATIKKVIQRDGRFENVDVPQCHDLASLCRFMEGIWSQERRRNHNSMAHIVKPTSRNRNGQPTTCWELLQNKLDKLNRLRNRLGNNQDYIEEFLKVDRQRHGETPTPSRNARATASATPRPPRPRRRLDLAPTPQIPGTPQGQTLSCSSCDARADCVCLVANCPFYKQVSCSLCFNGNHPILQRNHERIPLTDARAKALLREQRRSAYVPEYASGAFSILRTLYHVSKGGDTGAAQEYSLSESRLKKLAQQNCRSNLYDSQARGRNAFACVESLTDKGFFRKEIIPGSNEAKFSLLPPGEHMGRRCWEFDEALQRILRPQAMKDEQARVLASLGPKRNDVRLLIDAREDASYAERLRERCEDCNLETAVRELPAGDYLFAVPNGPQEMILPLVIERNSWSDLADSVNGKGRQRLDCVRIGRSEESCQGGCQLCRMKQCGCDKVLFVIEGARCLNRDNEDKCDNSRRCKYCKELVERHGEGLVQEKLEQVLEKLQAQHDCMILFTRGYNETIDSLLYIHDILGRTLHSTPTLSYPQFCTNSRRRTAPPEGAYQRRQWTKGKVTIRPVERFLNDIRRGKGEEFLRRVQDFRHRQRAHRTTPTDEVIMIDEEISAHKNNSTNEKDEIVIEDFDISNAANSENDALNESQESLLVLEADGWKNSAAAAETTTARTRKRKKSPSVPAGSPCINLADGSDEIEVVEAPLPKKARIVSVEGDDDEIVILQNEEHSSNRPRNRRQTADDTSSVVPLLRMTGMYEYDTEFCHDTNKVWKSAYSRFSNDSLQDNSFGTSVEGLLLELGWNDNADNPLVPRKTLLFWYLYAQLQSNLALRMIRINTELQSLRNAWEGRPCLPAADAGSNTKPARQPRSSTAARYSRESSSAERSAVARRQKTRRSLDFEEINSSDDDDDVLPLMNNTHRPINRPPRLPPPPNLDSQRTRFTPTLKRGMADKNKMIDARLRRFESSASSLPSSQQRTGRAATRTWKCHGCTLENSCASSFCELCGAAHSGDPKSSASPARVHSSKWSCPQCTLENSAERSHCRVCGSERVSQRKPEAAMPDPKTGSTWVCSRCTLENASTSLSCEACNFENPRRQHPSSASKVPSDSSPRRSNSQVTAAPSSSSRVADSKITCGACRLKGHNRASASAANCPAYNLPEEVEHRRKKRVEAQQKAREKREAAARFETEAKDQIERQQVMQTEMQRMLQQGMRQSEEFKRMSEDEVKRKKKAAERAEQRARRLAG